MLQATKPSEKYYEQIDAAKWERIRDSCRHIGIPIETNIGQGTMFDVTMQWNYDGPQKRLHIAVIESRVLPVDLALQTIDDMIQTA